MEQIKIDSGNEKEYEIVSKSGEKLGTIKIDVTDFGLLERAELAADHIEKILKGIHPGADKGIIKKTDRDIRKEVDYIFEYPVSDVVFGKQHCMNLKNGKTLVERFLEAIMPVIRKEMGKETESVKSRTGKYTNAYRKSTVYPYRGRGKKEHR